MRLLRLNLCLFIFHPVPPYSCLDDTLPASAIDPTSPRQQGAPQERAGVSNSATLPIHLAQGPGRRPCRRHLQGGGRKSAGSLRPSIPKSYSAGLRSSPG